MRLRVLAGVAVLSWLVVRRRSRNLSVWPCRIAQVMAGVNVEQVRLSPLGQYLLSARGRKLPDAGLSKLMETSGFDPRRDLREILFSANVAQRTLAVGVFLARGTFDVSKILVGPEQRRHYRDL